MAAFYCMTYGASIRHRIQFFADGIRAAYISLAANIIHLAAIFASLIESLSRSLVVVGLAVYVSWHEMD